MKAILGFIQIHQRLLVNLITLVIIFSLPYYLFQGKLFVGGDDTRLIYAYPWEYLKAMSFYSWINLSSVGYFAPNHFSFPFAMLWSGLYFVTKSRIFVDYLSFSLPLIIGFIYFQKLIKELLPRSRYAEQYVSTLFYLLSPILAINQLAVFLMSAWLIGLFPLIAWAFIKYIKTAKFLYVLFSVIVCIFLSLGLYGIPWVAGLLLPLFLMLPLGLLFYEKVQVRIFCIRSIVFFGFVFISLSFWTIPFMMQFFIKGNGIGSLISDRASTFRDTVIQTSTGNITYPLLNLFHRDLTFTHGWELRKVFLAFFDKTFFLNTIFAIVLYIGIFLRKKILIRVEKPIYILLFVAFLLSLFFYTVNIGPLKEIFLLLGYVPGFSMFRNAFDKFALGFVFLYGLVFAFSFFIVLQKFSKYRFALIAAILLVIIVNAIPLKTTINSPLWTTNSIYRTINFPQEYLQFLSHVKKVADPTANILNFPLNIAGYAIVKDDTSNNIFAGTSPTKYFTGINDFSGDLSFSHDESGKMWNYIYNRNYVDLNDFFHKYNVDEVMVTKNIPQEVKTSYLFFGGIELKNQDQALLKEITDKKLIVSAKGNYELYSVKNPTMTVSMTKGFFRRINPVQYQVFMHLTSRDQLIFKDSYNAGWKLYVEKYHEPTQCKNSIVKTMKDVSECRPLGTLFTWNELSYLFRIPFAQDTHSFSSTYNNIWTIDPKSIQKSYDSSYYKKNKDGSIDVLITVYFLPQESFYVGLGITAISLITLICLTYIDKKK